MKIKLILLSFPCFFIAFILAFHSRQDKNVMVSASSIAEFKRKNIVLCGPDWAVLKEWLNEVDIPPIPGAGSYEWKISTKNDSAQFYFNQGINMYYCFHIIESMASFKKAAKFDSGCAMLFWAQALAYGPNINDLGYRASPEALAATQKAYALSGTATNLEKGLIYAMSVRYTADSADASRAQLNKDYTEIMSRLYEKFPGNADVKALYADAMMLEHPWDLWWPDGRPKPWTPLIRDVLEKLLAKAPNHPGANHYYIHVMEPSPFADKALPCADRLGELTPGLSHTVHMPSHIYLRTGKYDKGIAVNENAVNSYKKTILLYPPVVGNDFLYIIHNLHMQTNNAMLAGRKAYSIQSAVETVNSIPKDYLTIPGALGNYVQYIYMTPVLVDIRFARWDELLNRPEPQASLVYANVLYHFGRGIAFSYKQKFNEAAKELDGMREFMKDSSLNIPFTPFSAAIKGARVAEQILLGVIHERRNLYDGAVSNFKQADSIERNMVYNEPRDWILNPKHFLGNVYLETNKWKEAETIFMKDLEYNNENGWALYGLYKAFLGQNKKREAENLLVRFKKAFKKADIKLAGPIL